MKSWQCDARRAARARTLIVAASVRRPQYPGRAATGPHSAKPPGRDAGEGPRRASRGRGLERDVVVGRRRGGAAAVARRRGSEVAGVDGDVGPRREAAATAPGVVATAEELHGVGDDVDRLALAALLGLPLAPLQAPVDGHRTPAAQVPGAVLALRAPDRDVEEVRLVDPLARRVVLAAGGGGDPQPADGGPPPERTQLRVGGGGGRGDFAGGVCGGALRGGPSWGAAPRGAP